MKKIVILFGFFLATVPLLPSAWALRGLFGPESESYLLNLCSYYALYDTRPGRIQNDLVLNQVRVEASIRGIKCTKASEGPLTFSEPVETQIHSPYIVELKNLRDVLDRLADHFEAQAKATEQECTPEKHLLVNLVFRRPGTNETIDIPAMDLKGTARSGFVFDAQGRSLPLVERGPIIKDPQETFDPQIRCGQMGSRPRIAQCR